jgi:DNA-directed RNA polymerase subunit RPC12/RpoP
MVDNGVNCTRSKVMPVYLECPDCGYKWMVFGKIIKEHEEEVIRIGMFDDVCPCGVQGTIYDCGYGNSVAKAAIAVS